MSQRSITVTFEIPDDFLQTAALENIRASLEGHASKMAYVIRAKATVDDPPSKPSAGPEITGQVNAGGQVSEFRIPLEDSDVSYSQWSANNTVLWPRADLMAALAEAGREWWLDNRPATDNEGEES